MRGDSNSPDQASGDTPRKPFEVIARQDRPHSSTSLPEDFEAVDLGNDEPGFSTDDMDRLYREALEAMEEVAADLTDACGVLSRPDSIEEDQELRDQLAPPTPGQLLPGLNVPTVDATKPSAEVPITPRQIIEAALFVGGMSLTAKKLCGLLRGDFTAEFVERAIDELNGIYEAEARPYEIRLGEGGYRMTLRSEHEPVRNRVFGIGIREVRLSQESLEILSLVAYRQPISRAELEATGRDNAGNVLRQLIRRELVTIQRGEKGRDDVRYRTTPRFLELFGLGKIDELPQADEIEMK